MGDVLICACSIISNNFDALTISFDNRYGLSQGCLLLFRCLGGFPIWPQRRRDRFRCCGNRRTREVLPV